MALTQVVMELGMGTDLQGEDHTKAACRAVHNALRQNSLHIADAFDIPRSEMQIEVVVGVGEPNNIRKSEIADLFPYGVVTVKAVRGGMDTPKEEGGYTVMANAAVLVSLDLNEGHLARLSS